MMPGLTDLQTILVADHRDGLSRDAAALRAERERDHRRDHALDGTDATDHRPDPAPRRVRLGRWLISVGRAIGGGPVAPVEPVGPIAAAAIVAEPDPCSDRHDHWASAA